MNPLKEEESEAEVLRPWRNRNKTSNVKSLEASKRKGQLSLSRPKTDMGRDEIDRILENYNYQALHDRIMRKILD